jgi:hypothetical protein
VTKIIEFRLKETYGAALRDQEVWRSHSKGYPALRDPAAEAPAGLLALVSKADEHKMRQHYGPAVQI